KAKGAHVEAGPEDHDLPKVVRRRGPRRDVRVEVRGAHGDPELHVREGGILRAREKLAFFPREATGPRVADERLLARAGARAVGGDLWAVLVCRAHQSRWGPGLRLRCALPPQT